MYILKGRTNSYAEKNHYFNIGGVEANRSEPANPHTYIRDLHFPFFS